MANHKVSVILPVYNEESVIENNVKSLVKVLNRDLKNYEIIISEDGSTDRTPEILKKLKSKKVHVLHKKKRLGKGGALKLGAAAAKGDIVIFMDADLASDMDQIKKLVKLVENGSSIVIGSRYHKNSKVKRTFIRFFASKSFNFLVRILLGSKLSDHQCGFKAFKKDMILPIIMELENEKWFWDAELLVRAQRKGMKIREVPLEWHEGRHSKFNLFKDTFYMAQSLILFKLRHG